MIKLRDEFLFRQIVGVLHGVGIDTDPSTYERICSPNDEEINEGIKDFLTAFGRPFAKETYLPKLHTFLEDTQRLLRQRGERYREHYRHSISVFALGVYLGMNLRPCDDVFKDKRHWILSWGVAALFHDLAYLFEQMRFFIPPDTLDISVRVNEGTATLYWNRFLNSRDDPRRLAITEKLKRLDHGATSAIWAMKQIWTETYAKEKGPDNMDDFEKHIFPAGEAMAIHTPDPSDEIHLSKSPLAHLLVLCDELQEWERDMKSDMNRLPELSPEPNPENVVEMEEEEKGRLIARIGFPVRGSLSELVKKKKENLRRLHGLDGHITIWNTRNEAEKEFIDLVA